MPKSYKVQAAAHEAAMEMQGVYPKSYNGKDRTKWQEGWNAAHRHHLESWIAVSNWLEGLSDDQQDIISGLILDEDLHVEWDSKVNNIKLFVNCNDVFMWGCADMEEIQLTEIPSFTVDLRQDPKWGSIKWVCRKRNEKPQYPIIWDMYKDGQWTEEMEALPDNAYNTNVGWDQTPTKPWRKEKSDASA